MLFVLCEELLILRLLKWGDYVSEEMKRIEMGDATLKRNLLILATRHLGWQQVATKWQQTQKSAVFGPIFLRHKKAENP